MISYKLSLVNRNYTEYDIYDLPDYNKKELQITPFNEKLFSNDVFEIKNGKVNIIHSSIRVCPDIPCVLILSRNKTYGRFKDKLLYKCIPDDLRIPAFLVPYEMKKVGFSKVFINQYVCVNFHSWDDKHPKAKLSKLIGPVNELDNFYEYQLYCKSLNASIQKFHKATTKALQNNPHEGFIDNIRTKYNNIHDRRQSHHVISIDPINSLDFDDAFSYTCINDTKCIISIYISNVTLWMDTLNLWDTFSRRISTIYLPDKKRPMLPTILSDCLCSLQEKVSRLALCMDITVENGVISNIEYCNCLVRVFKNYVYEEQLLLDSDHYKNIFVVTKTLSLKIKPLYSIKNSHDVVAYLMTLMNCKCADILRDHKTGLFRTTTVKEHISPKHVPDEVEKFIKIWKSSAGQYVDGSIIDFKTKRHDLMDLDAYVHITSPIRRLVDLLNIIKFQEVMNLIKLTESATQFYNNWLKDLDYINLTMRSIRKVQCDSNILDLCINNQEVLDKIYEGYLFDKILRADELFQYVVYLPSLRLSARLTIRDNINEYKKCQFKLYIFNNEEKFKKKIRLQLL